MGSDSRRARGVCGGNLLPLPAFLGGQTLKALVVIAWITAIVVFSLQAFYVIRTGQTALDEHHLWVALRYTELNPVRAGLVAKPESWPWSSASAHCRIGEADSCLEMEAWSKVWSEESWRNYLADGETESELVSIRQSTHTGRPLGSAEFVDRLEQITQRQLTLKKGGRAAQPPAQGAQPALRFEA